MMNDKVETKRKSRIMTAKNRGRDMSAAAEGNKSAHDKKRVNVEPFH